MLLMNFKGRLKKNVAAASFQYNPFLRLSPYCGWLPRSQWWWWRDGRLAALPPIEMLVLFLLWRVKVCILQVPTGGLFYKSFKLSYSYFFYCILLPSSSKSWFNFWSWGCLSIFCTRWGWVGWHCLRIGLHGDEEGNWPKGGSIKLLRQSLWLSTAVTVSGCLNLACLEWGLEAY